ncbi:hypothetical protein OS12_26530 [Dickeya oryzae]
MQALFAMIPAQTSAQGKDGTGSAQSVSDALDVLKNGKGDNSVLSSLISSTKKH